MHRSDIDALADQWKNGNRATVIEALSALDGVFSALAGAYLYHEMPDEFNRGIFARMLQAAGEKQTALEVKLSDEIIAEVKQEAKASEAWTYEMIIKALGERSDVHKRLDDLIELEAKALIEGSLSPRFKGRGSLARAREDAREFYVRDIAEFIESPRLIEPKDVLFNRRTSHAWGIAAYVRERAS